MNRTSIRCALAAVWALTLLPGARGAPPEPVSTVITSDTLVFDYGKMTAVFEGHVVVVDPEVTMTAAALIVRFDASNNVESVVASGGVEVKQLDRTGRCDQAVYTARNGSIVMTGKAELRRALDAMQGDEIQIYVNDERVLCKPGKLVIFPGTGAGATGFNRRQRER
jgi:lipopolysaccharide export system protein LptA